MSASVSATDAMKDWESEAVAITLPSLLTALTVMETMALPGAAALRLLEMVSERLSTVASASALVPLRANLLAGFIASIAVTRSESEVLDFLTAGSTGSRTIVSSVAMISRILP